MNISLKLRIKINIPVDYKILINVILSRLYYYLFNYNVVTKLITNNFTITGTLYLYFLMKVEIREILNY